jgi:hypothetical protein
MSNMEEIYGVVAALPAVAEGDRGVYEHESQHVAPHAQAGRLDHGSMKDYVYTDIKPCICR